MKNSVSKMNILLRLTAFLLAFTMIFSLVGCDNGNSGDASSKKPAGSTESKEPNPSTPPQGVTDKDGTLVVYPEYDKRIERDYMYDVKVVQGEKAYDLTCYNHCEAVSTSVRTVNGDMYRRFCEFGFGGGAVRVDITVYTDFNSYTVMPSAKGFKSTREGNVISVYLDKPDYFMLKLDASDDSILSVFAEELEEDIPNKGDEDVIYIDGWFEPEDGSTEYVISKSGSTVYIAPGAVLNARVKVIGDNITIKGRGMILDPYSDVYKTDISTTGNNEWNNDGDGVRYLLHVTGFGCVIDGIKMIDARDFNLWVQCEGLEAKNLKILSSQMCTDGITPHKGGGNSFEHCFIYVADNAIVLSSSNTTTTFKDITIGTICCGIFPQNNAGTYKMSDIYVFRCDEGLIRNCYNYNLEQRTFNLFLNNVSAVDVDHFPFIFYNFGMGDRAKNITFTNLTVPASTGSSELGKNYGIDIFVTNERLKTSNYTFTFNGLTVGGKAITDPSQLNTKMTDGNKIVVTGNGSEFGPAVAATQKGACKPAGKIFIGARRLDTAARAVQKDGTWYVPAEDICKALFKSVPANTTDINGVKYLSLSALTSSKIAKSASYDSAAGRINIAPLAETSGNLFDWFGTEAHSPWSEWISYNMHIKYLNQYGGHSYRLEECNSNCGISRNLTQQLQQYGAGDYTVSFKLKADKAAGMQLYFGVNGSNKVIEATATTEWKEYSIPIPNTVAGGDITNANLNFIAKEAGTGIEIRDAKIVYNG